MNQSICNICGANYEYRNGRWKCPACGAYKPEELSNEEQTLLYIADQKRRLADFGEAEQEYSDIIEKYPQNPYGYWGRLLSKHGIKYERDYDGKMIPTCCAPTIESLYTDKDCLRSIDLADADTKQYFTNQAEYIERIRTVWVNKANKEKPYDIFICYKDSDLGNGIDRTQDSIEAQEIYLHLISQGYRVFFSRESLRDKVGEKYEPYIFNALSTAKVMLLYGKSAEYITSTWLKNEWLRYLKMMKNGLKKPNSLIVAYEGFSPSELPTTLSTMQCLDASRKTFYTDLDKIMRSVIREESEQKQSAEASNVPPRSEQKKNNTGALVCPDCGGNFAAADLLDGDSLVTCLTCGKTFYTADIMTKKKTAEERRSHTYQETQSRLAYTKTVDVNEERRQLNLLISQLKEIDREKNNNKKRSVLAQIEENKADLIRSYKLPESFEILLDFFSFAVSSVDFDAYNLLSNNTNTRLSRSKKALARIWVDKAEEAYKKAKIEYAERKEFYRIESSYKKMRKNIITQRAKFPALMVGCFLPVIILLILAFTVWIPNIDYSDNGNNSSDTLGNGSQIVFDNNVTITKGTEYTYMCDEWSLYVIKAVSPTMIKIEKWGKTLSTSKTVSHEYDVGSFDIRDSSNGFVWMDSEQKAFYYTLKDSKDSNFKKGKTVSFSISISDSDTYKGSNYAENQLSYSYTNDDWHMYRAIPLSENLMKVECWYRSMAIGSFGYGYDVIIINLSDSGTSLQWTDDEHISFTISLKDTENSDLKNAKVVLFEKE